MVFFENKQNDERGSTRLLGKETQKSSQPMKRLRHRSLDKNS
jgi:hypothetical protein